MHKAVFLCISSVFCHRRCMDYFEKSQKPYLQSNWNKDALQKSSLYEIIV